MTDAQTLGEIRDYSDLLKVCVARKETLGITWETVDEIAGMARGHSAKIAAPMPSKHLGYITIGLWLGALGIKLIAVHDETALMAVSSRFVQRKTPIHSGAVHIILSEKYMRKIGKKGGENSRKNLSKKLKRKLARRAAFARWRKGNHDVSTDAEPQRKHLKRRALPSGT